MTAATRQINNFIMMLRYTLRTNACGLSDLKPLFAKKKEKKVAAKTTRLPAIKTDWSNPCRSSKLLPVKKKAFKIIKKVMIGSSAFRLFL